MTGKWTKERRQEHSRIMQSYHDKRGLQPKTHLKPGDLKPGADHIKYWHNSLFVRQVGQLSKHMNARYSY